MAIVFACGCQNQVECLCSVHVKWNCGFHGLIWSHAYVMCVQMCWFLVQNEFCVLLFLIDWWKINESNAICFFGFPFVWACESVCVCVRVCGSSGENVIWPVHMIDSMLIKMTEWLMKTISVSIKATYGPLYASAGGSFFVHASRTMRWLFPSLSVDLQLLGGVTFFRISLA